MKAAAAAFAADLQEQLRAEAAGDFSHVRSGGEGFGVGGGMPPPFASSTSSSSLSPFGTTTAAKGFGGSSILNSSSNGSGGSAPYVAGPLARQLLKQQQQEQQQEQQSLLSPSATAAALLLGGMGAATAGKNSRPLPVAALIASRQREEALAASRRRQLRALPFELRVLEACLDSSAAQFALLTDAIERAAAPCLRTPTAAKLTTDFLKRMRALKQRIVVTRIKLETITEVLDKLLDDDSDMASLDLTLRAETEESRAAEVAAAAAAAAVAHLGDENCGGTNAANDAATAAAAAVAAVAAHLDRKSISATSPAAALASYAAAAATTTAGGGGGGGPSVQGPPSSSGGVSPFDVSVPAPPKAASISSSVRSGREGKKLGKGRALAILARRTLLRRRRSAGGGGSGRAGSSVDDFCTAGDEPGDNKGNNSPAPSDAGAASDDDEPLPDPEEAVEMMLEAYSARMAGSLSRLDAVAELLEGVEALLDLELDVFRNANLVLRIVFSALGLVALAVYAFTGYWAMNMRERTSMGVAEDAFTDDEKKALLEEKGWVLTGAGGAIKLFPPGSHRAFVAWSVGISAVSVAALLVFGAWARWGAGLGLTTRAKGGKRGARRKRRGGGGRWPFAGRGGGGGGRGGGANGGSLGSSRDAASTPLPSFAAAAAAAAAAAPFFPRKGGAGGVGGGGMLSGSSSAASLAAGEGGGGGGGGGGPGSGGGRSSGLLARVAKGKAAAGQLRRRLVGGMAKGARR